MLKIRRTARSTSEITIASLSDVAFLLIIFFLVTTVYIIKEGIHLVLPDKLKSPQIVSASEVITVSIDRNANIVVGNARISISDAEELFAREFKNNKGLYVLLRIAGDLNYEKAIELIDIIKKVGIKKLSIRML